MGIFVKADGSGSIMMKFFGLKLVRTEGVWCEIDSQSKE